MPIFRVYLNTGVGRKTYECTADTPQQAGKKALSVHAGAPIVTKIKHISSYSEHADAGESPTRRMLQKGPNLQQLRKGPPSEQFQAIREAVIKFYYQ